MTAGSQGIIVKRWQDFSFFPELDFFLKIS